MRGCWHSVVPVVVSASRKGFGVLVKGRKADNKRWQSGPLSTENELSEEGEGCLEKKLRGRGWTGADTGRVANSLLSLKVLLAPWAPCDDGHGVIITASNHCTGKVFFRVTRLSWSLIQILQRLKRSKQGLVKKVEQIIMIRLFNAAERRTSKIVLS